MLMFMISILSEIYIVSVMKFARNIYLFYTYMCKLKDKIENHYISKQ